MRTLARARALALYAGGLVFPYYVLFIGELGANFTQFGVAYGLFVIASAIVHRFGATAADRLGTRGLAAVSYWGLAAVLLLYPMVTSVWALYALQILTGGLGAVGAAAPSGPRDVEADEAVSAGAGGPLGLYRGRAAVAVGVSVIVAGYVVDFLTLAAIFYIASILLFVGGLLAVIRSSPDRSRPDRSSGPPPDRTGASHRAE